MNFFEPNCVFLKAEAVETAFIPLDPLVKVIILFITKYLYNVLLGRRKGDAALGRARKAVFVLIWPNHIKNI